MNDQDPNILIYHYDKTEKFYLGCDVAHLNPRAGKPMVPADATLVAPPPTPWPDGHIPVFNGKTWDFKADNFWRPRYQEINYDAGRVMATWQPKAISRTDFPPYPDLIRLTASTIVVMRLVDNIRFIDMTFQRLVDLHSSFSTGASSPIEDMAGGSSLRARPTLFGRYKFESEALVFQIRHCLDTLCRLTELLVDSDRVNEAKCFRCDNVGSLFGSQKKSLVANLIRGLGGEFEADSTDFLQISNNLWNAMKHTHMNAETQSLYCAESPTIVAYHAPDGEHGDLIAYHNHNAYHLMMGFHDTIDRVLHNQRIFLQGR